MSKVDILECTLRDGSYVIDFQFSARDTAVIAAALEAAGCRYIEVGHGLGMHASEMGKGKAAATDEEYLKAAADTLKKAEWGMFFIPGIGRMQDLDMAADHGMRFVRIGTNATEVEQSKEFIAHAKKRGMHVSANFMKSYVLSPKEIAQWAKVSEGYGADLISLVDSAGCMMPNDIRAYISEMKSAVSTPLGFHGHDNLSLCIANALAAVESGAERIDTTLQGMGRGGGNCITEVFVAVLRKQGIELGIDLNRLMDISDQIIKPMLKAKGWDAIDITSGFAGFHSSYLKTILKYASKFDVNPRDLIVQVCKVNRVDPSDALIEQKAQELQKSRNESVHILTMPRVRFPSGGDASSVNAPLAEAAGRIAAKVREMAKKSGKRSVFNIVGALAATGEANVSRFVQQEFDCVIGSVELDNSTQLRQVVEAVDGIAEVLLVDSELRPYLEKPLFQLAWPLARRSSVLGYRDHDVWARSVERLLDSRLKGLWHRRVTLIGTDGLSLRLAILLLNAGARLVLTGETQSVLDSAAHSLRLLCPGPSEIRAEFSLLNASKDAEVLVSFSRSQKVITGDMVSAMRDQGIVFDAGIGSVAPEAYSRAPEKNVRILRPDMRAELAGELAAILGARKIATEIMGEGKLAGIPVVAGGLVGRYGDVVLDSINHPTQVVGVADGRGRVIYDLPPEFAEKVAKVEQEILRKQINVE